MERGKSQYLLQQLYEWMKISHTEQVYSQIKKTSAYSSTEKPLLLPRWKWLWSRKQLFQFEMDSPAL